MTHISCFEMNFITMETEDDLSAEIYNVSD